MNRAQVDLRQGHVLDVLRTLPDESVHCIITSPPYWGLRAYGTEPQIWLSGKEPCAEHTWESFTRQGQSGGTRIAKVQIKGKDNFQIIPSSQQDTCSVCGAWRGELGLEPTPELYVEHLTQIFREARRVLRNDGVLWLNMGDSYIGGKGRSGSRGAEYQAERKERGESLNNAAQTLGGPKQTRPTDNRAMLVESNLKPKDLAMIPFRVALALQADGWCLRSICPWIKRNGMPESVRDRPTVSHEYWFMLTKSPRYFWDAEAARKPLALDTLPRYSRGMNRNKWTNGASNATNLSRQERFRLPAEKPHALHQPRENLKTERKMQGTGYGGDGQGLHGHSGYFGIDGTPRFDPAGRNRRTSDAFIESLDELIEETREYLAHLERVKQGNAPLVDEDGNLLALYYSTQSFSDAHFATFSERMIAPLVLGSTSERGVCPKCGAPWVRVIKPSTEYAKNLGTWTPDTDKDKKLRAEIGFAAHGKNISTVAQYETTAWRPACSCTGVGDFRDDEHPATQYALGPIPATILDPFSGAGTTGLVALKYGRNYIGIELKPEYVEMTRKRLSRVQVELQMESCE